MPKLKWVDDDKARNAVSNVVMKILREDKSLSYGDPNSGNILVHGDNLEALQALLPFYAGRVKCIYIDPPYNADAAVEGYDDNVEHSTWLSIMYPRLSLMRDYLREDGLIFVQIDSNEMAYLKVMMDELFGRENYLTTITIKVKAPAGVGQESFLFDVNEYVLVYAKHLSDMRVHVLKEKNELKENTYKQYLKLLTNISEGEPVGVLKTDKVGDITLMRHNGYEFSTIAKEDRNESFYKEHIEQIVRTTNPQGGLMRKILPQIPTKGLYSITYKPTKGNKKESSITYHFLNGALIVWLSDSSEIENDRLYKLSKMTNLWVDNFFQGISSEGGVTFLNSKKPEALIERILKLSTDHGEIVLDAFLGSGTTCAVAMKMGRKCIGIEMGEHAKTHCAIRMKAVCDGEQTGISKTVKWQGGGGFKFYELGEPLLDENGAISEGIDFDTLAAHIWWRETEKSWDVATRKGTFLGVHDGIAYAMLFNGVLHDRSYAGGNVLTPKTMRIIREDIGEAKYDRLIVYGECTKLSAAKLKEEKVEFRQTPYDIVTRR